MTTRTVFVDGHIVPERTALVVAHPGHELRVHRWLEVTRPTVIVLTDGSGRTERSRLPSTERILHAAHARRGRIFGWCSDAELYAALLAGDSTFFVRMVRALFDALTAMGADCVVGDALEGFNPSHDLCRFAINAAVTLMRQQSGRRPHNFDFLLDGNPEQCSPSLQTTARRVDLDEADLRRKLAAAENYPELRAEAEAAIARYGAAAFATEILRPVLDLREGLDRMEPEPPYYERFGEQQVSAGHYREVIRYREHVHPIVNAGWREIGLPNDATGDDDLRKAG